MSYKDRSRQNAYNAEWMRNYRASQSGTDGGTNFPLEFKITCAQDVLDLLTEQINAVRLDEEATTLGRARCIGLLAGTVLKAIEVANIEGRLAALEATLLGRRNTA